MTVKNKQKLYRQKNRVQFKTALCFVMYSNHLSVYAPYKY